MAEEKIEDERVIQKKLKALRQSRLIHYGYR